MRSQKHFLVAGGGLAGLTASIELALAGHSVELHEQSKTLGGRAATQSHQGFAMNIGPHGFYRAGPMQQQFDAWGIAYSGRPPFGNGDAFLIAGGNKYRFPGDAAGLLRCAAFTIGEKLSLGKLMKALPQATARPGESMQEWIHQQSTRPAIHNFLQAMTRLSTYCAIPEKLDAEAGLKQLQIATKASVLYLDGGWETLITALAAKARSLGVAIHTDSAVTAVESGEAQFLNSCRPAVGIVLAIPPRAVEQLTGRTLPKLIPARAACLDLGLRRLPAKAGTFALGLDESTYVSVHSAYASGLAPAGGALVQLAMYLSTGETCTREELEQRADLILPGWRNELVYARFLPEMTVVHAIPAAHQPRPDVDALALPNVMLAGDWVGPEAMLADAAVSSGLRAARRLIAQVAVGQAAA